MKIKRRKWLFHNVIKLINIADRYPFDQNLLTSFPFSEGLCCIEGEEQGGKMASEKQGQGGKNCLWMWGKSWLSLCSTCLHWNNRLGTNKEISHHQQVEVAETWISWPQTDLPLSTCHGVRDRRATHCGWWRAGLRGSLESLDRVFYKLQNAMTFHMLI